MPIAYYAYYAHPPKTPMGATRLASGTKKVQPPFTPMRDTSPPFMLEF